MPLVKFYPAFTKSHKKFTKRRNEYEVKIKDILARFAKNPRHPSLHLEKLSGSNIWTIRIDLANRLFFQWDDSGDTAIFFYVGRHDSYKTITKK